ncbi:Otopetrin-3 [Folsomia candida]|uniref:Otopetrin-3 n=2 Tax=Folsomia candida TaxID=158441 RepID=A0A226E7N2_FOLCA|nr:Otopetrin-3 [Folsomia candida]
MKSRLTSGNSTAASPPRDVSSDSEECASGSVDHNHHYDTEANLDHSNKQRIHFGSFYLRMGAVAFGIGSMIYSGLEFGQYFELDPDTKCHNFMIALTPAVRMIFTFMQMYFIFLNSKMVVYKLELGAHFGLMHMIGTNLCVWLNVLVQETRHEILMFYNPDNGTITYPNPISGSHSKPHLQEYAHPIFTPTNSASSSPTATTTTSPLLSPPTTSSHASGGFVDISSNSTMATLVSAMEVNSRVRRGLKGPYSFLECRRSDIMGNLVQNASPFLFPCSIEYSLICAAILYVMWKSMAKINNKRLPHGPFHQMHLPKRSPHHYSVDCARANKGLFLGIFVLVMTIISLILFFVLITRPGYQALAVLEVNITEFVLYTMTTVAVLIGMCQMRELRYVRSRNLELDNILLIVAQTGSFIYNVFTIIGGHFTMKKNTALVLVTALSSLIQLLVQTLFILDASKRSAATSEQARRKPGREVVTFLLVTNLAMWAINTLEKSRADSHPVQLKFYGVWAWTIITHISMPLAIFYRFHSTVCLCEIWKRAYKVKPPVYR